MSGKGNEEKTFSRQVWLSKTHLHRFELTSVNLDWFDHVAYGKSFPNYSFMTQLNQRSCNFSQFHKRCCHLTLLNSEFCLKTHFLYSALCNFFLTIWLSCVSTDSCHTISHLYQGCALSRGPIDVQILLDSSGSIDASTWDKLMNEMKEHFIDSLMTHPDSRMAIARFGTESEALTYDNKHKICKAVNTCNLPLCTSASKWGK